MSRFDPLSDGNHAEAWARRVEADEEHRLVSRTVRTFTGSGSWAFVVALTIGFLGALCGLTFAAAVAYAALTASGVL